MIESPPLKILYALPGLDRGGAERQLSVLAPALQAKGHEVTISVAYAGGFYEQQLREQGVTIHIRRSGTRPLPHETTKRIRQAVDELLSLLHLVRSNRFDIVHSYGLTTNLYIALLKPVTQGRLVWGIRNSTILGRFPHKYLERYMSRLADLVIANSNAGKEACRAKGYPMERVRVIENGIDTNRFTINENFRWEVRRSLNLDSDDILVGIVGRLDPVKDHETFLRAAAAVLRENSAAKFLVVGGGTAQRLRELKEVAESLGVASNIIWTGVQPDVERYLNAMDVFVLCSPREGFPNAVAEAMACGIPPVVTDAGDASRIVDHLGIVVPIQNPDALAQGILNTIRNRDQLDKEKRRQLMIDRWSVSRMVVRTESELRRLVSQRTIA